MTLGEWGQACLTFFVMLVCFGCSIRRTRWLWLSCGLLSGADFLRGVMYQGGGQLPPGWWGSWSGSWPAVAAWVLAFLYCSWALYPLWLVATGASVRTFAAVGLTIVLSALIASVWPVQPPWMMPGVARAVDVVPVLRELVAGDVSPEAAFPSVHVAIPVVVALCERSWSWSAYAVITGVVVVLAGEHWVIDVLGGVCVAVAVVMCAAICGGLVNWCSAAIACRISSSGRVRVGASGHNMLCAGELVDDNRR